MTARRTLLAAALAAALGFSASAQSASGQPATSGDPPSRVGRLAQISGTVSFHTYDEAQWEAARLNYPITSGNSLWTEPQAHAAVDIGGSRIYLDSSTELDIGTLNDQGFQASLPQGAVFLRIGNDGGFEIDTPRGAVTLTQPGRYEIDAGDADHPTTVAALDGTAQIAGPGVNMTVASGQSAFLSGQNPVSASTGAIQQDAFLQYAMGAEQPYQQQGPAQQYVSPGVTGYQDLNQYGQWQQTPDYGPVWMPQVAVGWAPYRYGSWAYVAPWGWTWVDDSPWGFAPFHYGRWVQIGGFWGWTPGIIVAQPVYAPAVVSFFGDFGGVGIGVSFGIGPAVGWVPLGPQEIWYPPYPCGRGYFQNVNITNVNVTKIVNVNNFYNTTIINNTYVNKYMNHGGATVVPASAMADSRPVGSAFRNVSASNWQQKLGQMPARAQPSVKPTLRTAGMTPTLARRFGQTLPVNGQIPGRQRSPGPTVASSSQTGTALANGHALPAFLSARQKGGQIQSGGRFAGLGALAAGTQRQAPAGQSFGGFAQQNAQAGQALLKKGAAGPAIQPRNTSLGGNRSFASLGTGGTGANGSLSRGQGWFFLPPLKKQPQGSQSRTVGLQGNLGGGRQWASLPPLQKQPQASRSGQVGSQSGASWQQPQIFRNNSQQGTNRAAQPGAIQPTQQRQQQNWKQHSAAVAAQMPASNSKRQQTWSAGATQGNRSWQAQGSGFTFQSQAQGSRNWQSQGGGLFNFQGQQQQRAPQQQRQTTASHNGQTPWYQVKPGG